MKHNRTVCRSLILSFIAVSVISLTGCLDQKPRDEPSSVQESSISGDILKKEYDFRERCGAYCIDYFQKLYRNKINDKSDNYTTYIDYVSHYNKIRNRCYLLVKSRSVHKKKTGPDITTEHIIDAHENKTFGEFTISVRENISDVKKNKNLGESTISGKEDIISECRVLDEKCASKEGWEKLTKPYMDEESYVLKLNIKDLLSY